MFGKSEVLSSGWMIVLSVMASLALALGYPTPAHAGFGGGGGGGGGDGCGEYTETVDNCPNQEAITEICEDHAGTHCDVKRASCLARMGPDRITCTYVDQP